MSDAGSLSSRSQYYFKYTYLDGTQVIGPTATYDGTSGIITATLNTSKVIDYVEFFVLKTTYKIVSIGFDYVKALPVSDDPLQFTLKGIDYDGDTSNIAAFTVNRIAGTTGADDIAGTSLADTISGGAGADKIAGVDGAEGVGDVISSLELIAMFF